MKIRKITKKEITQLTRLVNEENKIMKKFVSFPIYMPAQNKDFVNFVLSSLYKKGNLLYGIYIYNELVGFLSAYIKKVPGGKVGYLDNLFVSKKYQGRGYSKSLRNFFFSILKKKNIKHCQLNVLHKNIKAVEIYKKWGFRTDGMQMTKKI
jgi:ribosomal protein S18 acetylase RimI-like enzyme